MLPVNTIFPKFVPDQLLTSEDLNRLFGYLDEQGRMTRTNLIGIGIVCGLEVQTNAAGTSITITKGCGVTSEGYLVTVPDNTYTEYADFDPVKERYYDRFVNIGTKTKKFNLWELTKAGTIENSINLNDGFLSDKVVLIFVELKEEGNKNCDPNSCDDKGVDVTVTFRPLLVAKADAASLIGVPSVNPGFNTFQLLPEISWRRYDVPFTFLIDTARIVNAYLDLFKNPFLPNLQQSLTQAYNVLGPFVSDEFASNPFSSLSNDFAFLTNGSMSPTQLLHVQYYYDLFSDLIQAYHELRRTGAEVMSICCPDAGLFPRHLLLGEAIGYSNNVISGFRHYFIPSPALSRHSDLTGKLRFLFKKLVLLAESFALPPVQIVRDPANRLLDTNIRITPSKLGDISLSEKAIPYYYKVNEAPAPLYKSWNHHKSITGTAHRNLSYHAPLYNGTDDDIRRPLLYELEPYNFFRIEGHIGKHFVHVLRHLQLTKIVHRLPFDIIALNADLRSLLQKLMALRSSTAAALAQALNIDPEKVKCHFNDLEALYDTTVAEITCCLCQEMKYFYNLDDVNRTNLPPLNDPVPKAPLLVKCAPAFRITPNTLGHRFEAFFIPILSQPYIYPQTLLAMFGNNSKDPKVLALMLLYYMQKTFEALTDRLDTFDAVAFTLRHGHLLFVVQSLKETVKNINTDTGADSFEVEDIIDHLDALLHCCPDAKLRAIYQEYLSRWIYLLFLQSFGYYATLNPGITHKAGVPVGGTFILVYHQKEPENDNPNTGVLTNTDVTNNFFASGDFLRTGRSTPSSVTPASESGRATETMATENIRTANLAGASVYNAAYSNILTKLGADKFNLAGSFLSAATNEPAALASVNELIREIGDGVVIADFYLPYLCCSDCPPVQFVLPDVKETDRPAISLEPNEATNTHVYCSNDQRPYAFTVSPAGGDIQPKDGVEQRADGTFIFTPVKVAIGNNASLSLPFVYSKDGQSSAPLTAVVNHVPIAGFEAQAGATSPTVIVFNNTTQFADTYAWDFGNGQTATEKNPTHDFKQAGNFTVTLKAGNGSCTDSFTRTIEIRPQKNCLPLADVIDEFNRLRDVQPDRFDPFTDIFQSYSAVEAFFKELGTLVTEPVDKQIEFFVGKETGNLLLRWLRELGTHFDNIDIRLLAFALYRILVNLALYIACIQPEDIDRAKVNLMEVFQMVQTHLEGLAQLVPNMLPEEKDQWRKLLETLQQELERVVISGEEAAKPNYTAALKRCVEIILSFNF